MSEVIQIEPVPGWRGQVRHGERLTLTSYEISADAPDVHEHQHVEEEAWTVIDGCLLVCVEGREQVLGPGDYAIIRPNARHWVSALQPSRALVIDAPARHRLPGSAH